MVSSYILILIFSLQLLQFSQSATVVVDGVSQWKNPQLQIGDSVIFQHKYHYSLYIFKKQDAFSHCNFTQATILTNPNSSIYIWRTSRAGFFYFAFYNGSSQACLEGQKLAVKVKLSRQAAAPAASSPAFPWPFQPRDGDSPSPVAPEREGVPFINSNPAVPRPPAKLAPLPSVLCLRLDTFTPNRCWELREQ